MKTKIKPAPPMKDFFLNTLQLEHQILVVLYFMVYLWAMLIQIKDPNTTVRFLDWVLAFLASAVGATITFFGVMTWANIGVRMTVTILVSLMSYRTMKFLASDEAQDEFAKGFWKAIGAFLNRIFNGYQHKDKKDEER